MAQRLLYILPKRYYFAEGGRGRVSHALGLIQGFCEQGWQVTVVSGDGLNGYRSQLPASCQLIEVSTTADGYWPRRLNHAINDALEYTEPDITLVRYATSLPHFLIPLARRIKGQGGVAVTEVNSFAYHNHTTLPSLLRRIAFKWEAMVAARFDLVYVVSQRLKEQLLASGVSTAIAVVPNGAASTTPKAIGKNPASTLRLKYFGVLQPYYDFAPLIDAYRELKKRGHNIELHFHGDGAQLEVLKDQCQIIDGVYFHGRYEQRNVPQMVAENGDVLMLPYSEDEDTGIHSPIKLFEYMALGAPIVACRGGQISEIIQHDSNGLLFAPGNRDALIENIQRLIEEPGLRVQLASQARRDFLSDHTWASRAQLLIEQIHAIQEPLPNTV